MHVHVRDDGPGAVVAVSGRITIDSSPELRSLLFQRLFAPGGGPVTLDLSKVVYMDTSALAVLLEVLRAAGQLHKDFHLAGLSGRPRYLMEATGLIHLFREVPLEASA